jgi:predicted transcriptional regulator
MVKLLKESFENQIIPLSKLITMQEAGIEDADLARELDDKKVEEFRLSDEQEWPAIEITASDKGYIVIDGRHRWRANELEKREGIKATCKPYASEAEIIEAAFEFNIRHGLGLNAKSRSNYAYILHKHHPEMKQEDIAKRCHISQAAVSKVIKRRKKPTAAAKADKSAEEHGGMRETLHTIDRGARKFLDSINKLSPEERRRAILDAIESPEERDRLLDFAHQLEEMLQPPKRRGTK